MTETDQSQDAKKLTPQLFDVIVGNPPYVSYYSRQSQGDENTQKQLNFLVEKYDFIKNKKKLGRYNTVMFFIAQALILLKDNGYLGFIVDTNIHSNPYQELREWLAKNFSIIKIVDEIDAFEDVASYQVILIIKKTNPGSNHKTIYQKPDQNNSTQFITVDENLQSRINEQNNFSFKIPEAKNIRDVLDIIEKSPKLVDLVGSENIRTCITFTGKKDFFVFDRKESDIDYPLLEGSEGLSSPYSLVKSSKWIRYDLTLRDRLNREYTELAKQQGKRTPMVIGLGNLERFKSPKIFIRLSDSRLTASFTEEFVCADLSLYILTLPNLAKTNIDFNLLYLLGVINSSIATFYFIQKGFIRNLGTGTPQIRLKDVRSLPIPKATPEQQTQIAELVDRIMNLKKESQAAQNSFVNLILAKYLETSRQALPATPQEGNFNVSTKLKNWSKLDAGGFLGELKKQKAVIGSLAAEAELIVYFNEQKSKVLEIEGEAGQVDAEIEGLVRGLYGV